MPDPTQVTNPIATANNGAATPLPAPAPNPVPSAPSVDSSQPAPASVGADASTVGPTATAGQRFSTYSPGDPGPNGQTQDDHHRLIGKIFSKIAGNDTEYAQTPNGPVPVQTQMKTGQLAKTILASAFSLMAAGTGGMLAAKEKRPFELDPNTSIGGMREKADAQKQQAAQKTFENTQVADEETMRKHRDAMEQQKAIQEGVIFDQQRKLNEQRISEGDRKAEDDMWDSNAKRTLDYQQTMSMPGSQLMKDANGQELHFLDLREAQDYAIKHPDTIHGTNDGTAMFGVKPVFNTATGTWQIADYPAERHQQVVVNLGQKKDKNGEPMYDKDGNPIADGTVIDPHTKKPTVVTQNVTPDQARDILTKNLTQRNIESEIADRDVQARQREQALAKNDELSDAVDAYDAGNFDKMTPRQRSLVARMTFQEQTLASRREQVAQANLTKAQAAATGNDDPALKKAQADYDEAKSDYDDIKEKYNQLTGNTAGVQLGNKIIRGGTSNQSWTDINNQINSSPDLSDDEKKLALNKVYNALKPPKGATHVVAHSDQKMHWARADGLDLGVAPLKIEGANTNSTQQSKPASVVPGQLVTLKNGQTVTVKSVNSDGSFSY